MQEPFYNHIIENSGERTARCQRSPGVEGRANTLPSSRATNKTREHHCEDSRRPISTLTSEYYGFGFETAADYMCLFPRARKKKLMNVRDHGHRAPRKHLLVFIASKLS